MTPYTLKDLMEGRAVGAVPGSPQEAALATDADIVLMGGANGGAKTYTLALAPMAGAMDDPEFRGIMFRRSRPELKQGGGLVDETKSLYRPQGATFNETSLDWRFPHPTDKARDGARVQLRPLQYDDDWTQYDGGQYTFMGFDQLEQFSAKPFFSLIGRLRSPKSSWEPFCFASCNPAPKGHWLYEFAKPWLDDENEFPDEEKAGTRRWFFPEGEGGWRWVDEDARETITTPDGEQVEVPPISVEFHPATVFDNPFILKNDPKYVQKLNALPKKIRMAKLHGAWGMSMEDGPFSEHQIQVVGEDRVPSSVRFVRYWDLADTEPHPNNPKPCHTAGVKVGVMHRQWTTCGFSDDQGDVSCSYWQEGYTEETRCPECGHQSLMTASMPVVIVRHATWFMLSGNKKQHRMVQTAKQDGRKTKIGLELEPGATGKESGTDYEREVFPRGYSVTLDRPTGDKMTRLTPLVSIAETGRMWVVDGPWVQDYTRALELLKPMDVADATAGGYKQASDLASKPTLPPEPSYQSTGTSYG